MKLILSFVVAALFPALLISAWSYAQFSIFDADDPDIWTTTKAVFVMVLFFSTGFVFIFGFPSFFLLRWANCLKWWSTLLVGFILGALPLAIFSWPYKSGGSASVNGVRTIIDGIPTLAGWLQYIYGFTFMGIMGVVGALAFWLVWRNC